MKKLISGIAVGLIIGFVIGVCFKNYTYSKHQSKIISEQRQEEIDEQEALKRIHLPPGYEFLGSSPDKRIAVFAKKSSNVNIFNLSGDDDGRIYITAEASGNGAQFEAKFYMDDTLTNQWKGKPFGEKERLCIRCLEPFNRVLINFEAL